MCELEARDVKVACIAFTDAVFDIEAYLKEQKKPMFSPEQLKKILDMTLEARDTIDKEEGKRMANNTIYFCCICGIL